MARNSNDQTQSIKTGKAASRTTDKSSASSKNSLKPLDTSVKKSQAELARSKSKDEIYREKRNSLLARFVTCGIFFFLGLFLFLSLFTGDGSALRVLRHIFTGLFGLGYFLLPFACFYIAWILLFKNDQPALLRCVCVILTVYFFSALLHTLRDPKELTESLVSYLWTSGQNAKSGGLLPGLLAHALRILVSRVGAFIVCAVFLLLSICRGFNLKISRLIHRTAVKKREVIRRAEEAAPADEPEDEIDTLDDLRVLGTTVRSVKQSPEVRIFNTPDIMHEPPVLTDEQRATFDVPIGSDPVGTTAKKSRENRKNNSGGDVQRFIQPARAPAEQNSCNAFDIPIGGDSASTPRSRGTRRKTSARNQQDQLSTDDLLVFNFHTDKKNNTPPEPISEPDEDLIFFSGSKRKLPLKKASSKWDIPLGDPIHAVDAYTTEIQNRVRAENRQTQPVISSKRSHSGSSVQNPSSEVSASEETQKFPDLFHTSEPEAAAVKQNFPEPAALSDNEASDLPVIAEEPAISAAPAVRVSEPSVPVSIMPSPTESEIEAGAKKAKKSGSLNKGEAEAAEALVSMEIAEGEYSDAASQYHFPPMQILTEAKYAEADNTAEMREKVLRLEATLKSFGIDIKVENVVRGPSVTRYEMELKPGTKMSRITSLNEDIALSLGVASVRVAAVPGKSSTIGIEVPNVNSTSVPIRSVMDSKEFRNAKSNLAFAVGKDISGAIIIGDIAKMPHLLIAGTTGSGKSVCMNSIIVSLLYRTKPEQCRMIMIDPKVVELSVYNGIPHLLIPVVTDAKKAAGALQWAVTEMERRYNLLAEFNVRDLAGYNKQAALRSDIQPLPQIVVIIDELADLMLVAAKEVENSIVRIAQKARAAGMHLVIATQRPSANVITGLMKANIPSRIAFAVSSAIDSRIILDTGGAEKLLGKGDMLFAPIGSGSPKRVQGCFITDEEVESVVSAVKESGTPEYDDSISAQIENTSSASEDDSSDTGSSADNYDGDPQFAEAVEVVLDTKQASVSMLQRRLRLGYAHAARIVDEMEDKGIVGPFEGSKPRQLLITREQWNTMIGMNPNARPGVSEDDLAESEDGSEE